MLQLVDVDVSLIGPRGPVVESVGAFVRASLAATASCCRASTRGDASRLFVPSLALSVTTEFLVVQLMLGRVNSDPSLQCFVLRFLSLCHVVTLSLSAKVSAGPWHLQAIRRRGDRRFLFILNFIMPPYQA